MGGYWNGLATTEILRSNGTISAGPLLPIGVNNHCMVTRIDGKVVITGGVSSIELSRNIVWIFNPNNETYEFGPQMGHDFSNHGCAVFKSALHNYREVILVAGGTKSDKVELWDYQTPNSGWISSKCNFVFDLEPFMKARHEVKA